jgi:hypothetical protein
LGKQKKGGSGGTSKERKCIEKEGNVTQAKKGNKETKEKRR